MIEFYIIGSVFSFIKFNTYINQSFQFDEYDTTNNTKCKNHNSLKLAEKSFNRFEFIFLRLKCQNKSQDFGNR